MLISLDVAFRNLGWIIFHGSIPKHCGVITTKKSSRKDVLVSDNRVKDCVTICRQLSEIITRYGVDGIIGELPGGSRSAKAAGMLGMATAVVSCVSHYTRLPAEWCTPDDVKVAVTGSGKASKDEIMDRIIEKYGGSKAERRILVKKGKKKGNYKKRVDYTFLNYLWAKKNFEHIADAAGVYMALQDSNLVKMFG
jgi:Holliday junction resolvasome RuvABC endonuclease subunit